jgi:hypothetical protein
MESSLSSCGIYKSKYDSIRKAFIDDCDKLTVKELHAKYTIIPRRTIQEWKKKDYFKQWKNMNIKTEVKETSTDALDKKEKAVKHTGIYNSKYDKIRDQFILDSRKYSLDKLISEYKKSIRAELIYQWDYTGKISQWNRKDTDNKTSPKPIGIMKSKYDSIREQFINDLKNEVMISKLASTYKIPERTLYNWRNAGYFIAWAI